MGAGLVVLAVLSGCAGDGDGPTKDVAASDAGGAPGTTAASGAPGDVGGGDKLEPEFEAELLMVYSNFLSASDLHRIPDGSTSESGLADLAAPSVVAIYDAWRATNESYGEGFQRVRSFRSDRNVLGIDVAGPQMTIRDCTQETRELIGGSDVTDYVTRVVTVADEGSAYRVVKVDVRHQGDLFAPGYACIPDQAAAKATATAEEALEGFIAAQGDPRRGLAAPVDAVVAGQLEEKWKASLAEQAAKNYAIAAPYDMKLTVLGLDRRLLARLGAVVSACITYAEGLDLRELSSGKVVREVLPDGTQTKLVVAVRLEEAGGPVVFADISEDLSTKC